MTVHSAVVGKSNGYLKAALKKKKKLTMLIPCFHMIHLIKSSHLHVPHLTKTLQKYYRCI